MSLSLFQAAAEVPRRTALVADGEAVTFAALALRVRAAVAWLERQGPPRQGRAGGAAPVGLLAERSVETLVLLYALTGTGVPVALVDPRLPASERRRWLAEIGADPLIDPSAVDLERPAVRRAPSSLDDALPDDERPLAIVRTSGTGGRPKGVVLSRRAFAAAAASSAENLGWQSDDRWLLQLPLAHVSGLSIVTRCLLARRAVVLPRLARFDAARVARILERDRVTLLSLVPTMLQRLLDLEAAPPPHLRAILLGGAGSSPRLLERSADRGWPVLTTYGLTEACSQVATQRYGEVRPGERGAPPVAGMEVRILRGAIEIRGPSLMSGYLPSGEAPPFDADGWFSTGDLGRLEADGRLHVLGRRDEVIVSGGENLHPREVEEALEAHPAIAAACVFGVDDPEWGQAVAAALVSPRPPADEDLVRFLGDRLAAYQRPLRIAWVDELPRLPTGKLDRRRAATEAGALLRRLVS